MGESDFRQRVNGVDVIRWNPRGADGTPVDNVGDVLGPLIVERILAENGLRAADARVHERGARESRSLAAVGSILQFAEPGDVVWGSGVNLKVRPPRLDAHRILDVRAVRGPLSRLMLSARGNAVPPVYGDPALLLPSLFPEMLEWAAPGAKRRPHVVMPNLNDLSAFADRGDVVSPLGDPFAVVRELLGAEMVVGSSLHAIVIAEAFGIPARLVRSGAEHPAKYVDYYAGTGRWGVEVSDSVEEALALGGAEAPAGWSSATLLDAFPLDLWRVAAAPEAPEALALADGIDELRDLIRTAAPTDRPALDEMARRTVLPALAQRADAVDADSLDRIVAVARELDALGVFEGGDPRFDRTWTLARLGLTDDLRRSSLLNRTGHRAILRSVRRAESDGILHLGGSLQLPDFPASAVDLSIDLAEDGSDARTPLALEWSETNPRSGSVSWTTSVDLTDVDEGSYVLVVHAGDQHDPAREVTVRSGDLRLPRWWLDDGTPYRVDRTGRGNAVIHVEAKGDRA